MKGKQNKNERRKRTLKNCGVMVCNGTELMTGDGVFVTMEVYKEDCSKSCSMKQACGIALSLLAKGKWQEAIETLKNSKL